jgi:hypothetical protein
MSQQEVPVSLGSLIPRQSTEDRAVQRAGTVGDAPLPAVNYLEMIFEGQRHLMAKYHALEKANGSPVVYVDDEGQLDDRQVQARLHELFGFLMREMAEAMQELKNKPWKKTEAPTDIEAFVNEIGDAFHFFVEFCITAGIDAETLHRAYFRMHMKNNDRLAGTY